METQEILAVIATSLSIIPAERSLYKGPVYALMLQWLIQVSNDGLCQDGLLVLLPYRLGNGGVLRQDCAELGTINGLLLLQELHNLVNGFSVLPAETRNGMRDA